MPLPIRQSAPVPPLLTFGDPALAIRASTPTDLSGGSEGFMAPLQVNDVGQLRVESDTPLDVWNAADTATASAASATVTYAAPAPDQAHVIDGVIFSYSAGSGTSGTLTIGVGSGPTTVFQLAVTANGTYQVIFRRPKIGPAGGQLVITLTSGGTSVVGDLNVLGHRICSAIGSPTRLYGILDFSDPNQSGLS